MNGKKISGNGSKATLPGGQNLSDKIQENKIKQGLNNNQNKPSNINNQNIQDSTSDNKENDGGKKKSKVDNAIQQGGTEASRVALKTAAASNPYTGWIPKGIRDKIVDKVVDSKLGQKVIEKEGKKLKRKMVMAIVGVVGSFLFSILMISAIAAAILSPVSAINDTLQKTGNFFVSVWNIFKYGEYCSSDKECQEKLSNKYYDKLNSSVEITFQDCPLIDQEQVKNLITGTIFYDQMMYDSNYSDFTSNGNSDESNNNSETNTETDSEDYSDLIENDAGYFDYRGKSKQIQPLLDVLKSEGSCLLNSYAYRNHLRNKYIEKNYDYILVEHYKDGVEGKLTIDEVVEEIMMIGGFENKGSNGSCSDSCTYNVDGEQISDIKVRLIYGMYTDKPGEPIEGEELVPFEKYILGVVYAEVGSSANDEVLKAQAIAARSFALTRGKKMGGALGLGLHNEDGQWILTIRSSTEDQVYCDPDKGCSKIGGVNSTVFSDPDKYTMYKGPLAEDAKIRTVVNEVAGKVALNSEGEIINTPYTDVQQNLWTEKANAGKDYSIILKESYSELASIDDGNCSSVCSSASGAYTEWKQFSWPNVYMNSLSLSDAGCLTVSVCMQVARSGVETPLGADFNPGTFVEEYRDYLYSGNDNWNWYGIQSVIPNFMYDRNYQLANVASMDESKLIEELVAGINDGCYYVVEVKSYYSGQHWVAIDTIQNGEIYIMDPASDCKTLSECKSSSTGAPYKINYAQCYKALK